MLETPPFMLPIRRGIALTIVTIVLVCLGAGTAAAAESKRFTASIAASGSTFTLMITNLASSSQALGSANVTVPSGHTVTGFVSITAGGGAKVWSSPTLSGDGRTIFLRNAGPNSANRLAPGESLVVVFTVSTTACATATSTWTVTAKQSNDFKGAGNDFTISGSQPTTPGQPGALDHFTLSPVGQQTANTAFSVTATAYDTCGNQMTNYGGGAVLGGLGNAPNGQAPSFGALTFSGGVATASVTAFLAGTNQTLTVADGAVSASSNSFTVLPGALSSFAFGAVGALQTAGTPFAVSVTARDAWLNVKTNYAGVATLSGTLTASTKGCGSGASSPCSPIYGTLSFASGVGTANVTAFRAETARTLGAADGTATGMSNQFDVVGGEVADLAVGQQPTDTTSGTAIAPPITVLATDVYGNPAGATVTMAIGSNPSAGTLSGTKTRSTVGGAATFADLSIDKTGIDYTLVASVGSITTTSEPFDIVTVVVGCTNHPNEPCVGSTGSDTNPQTPTNAEVFAPAGGNPGTLTISLIDFAGACPNGSGQSVVVNPPNGHGNNNPVQVKVEYDKSITPGTGVTNFVFCVEKLAGLVIEPVPACKDSAGTAQPFPCIDDRRRDNAGDLRVRFLITDDPIFTKR